MTTKEQRDELVKSSIDMLIVGLWIQQRARELYMTVEENRVDVNN